MEVLMETLPKFLTLIIGFPATMVFGFWLSRSGKPYNGILFNIHKLIALGAVIVTVVQVYKLLKNVEPQALIVILLIITGICVVALFASGAFMSIGNLNYQIMKTIHNVAFVLLVIVMALTIYLFIRRNI
jgi:heme A synthase